MRVLIFLLVAAVAVAQETECDAIVAAAKAGDKATLGRYAKAAEPGAWVLAHVLCARGEFDAALALAKAAPSKDRARLPAYIESRRGKGDDAAARKVLGAALGHFGASRAQACIDAIDGHQMKGGSALEVKLNAMRAYCLVVVDRTGEAMEAWLVTGIAAHALGDLATAAQVLETAGNAAHTYKRFVAARESWSAWADVEHERGDAAKEAEALYRATRTYAQLGKTVDAQLLERVIALNAQLGNSKRQGELLGTLASAYAAAGDHARAIDSAEKGLKLVEASGDVRAQLQALRTVGSVYASVREFDKALKIQMRVLDLAKQSRNPVAIAMTEMQIGQILDAAEQYDKARPYFERALGALESARHPFVAYAHYLLGGACQQEKENEKALAHHVKSVELAARSRDERMKAMCLVGLADIYMVMLNWEKALPILKRTLRFAERLEQQDALVRARWGMARCELALKRPKEALATIKPAVDIVTRIYRGLGEEQASEARAQYARVFDLAATAARDVGDVEQAFHFLEVARAGTLLESLGGRAQLRGSAIPQELLAEETEARAAVAAARARYDEARGARDFRQSKARKIVLDAALGTLKDTIQTFERESKLTAQLLYPGAATLAETRATLTKGEALVLFSVRHFTSLALVVTADAARIVRLGESDALHETCDAIALDDTEEDPAEPLAALRKQIVDPLKLGKDVRRVLVSPDGSLSYVPFCLLLGGREVAYVPSGTTYGTLRAEAGKRGEKVLALGDPVYGEDLAALPHTRAEAKAIGDVVLLGADATKEGLAKALGAQKRWRAIHFACHGLVDIKRPTLSSLAITGGRLSAYEIMRLDLAADLVTLSACETGKGKIVRGEGLLGLTRAFMVAGTPRVIVSLWPVEDAATSALMTHFYEQWRKGTAPATALAQAQAKVRANKKWSHPNYWAAWQLWGLPG